MLKNIVNMDGVDVLSKEEQKNVNGGYRNCVRTGAHQFLYSPDNTLTLQPVAVAETCEWKCEKEFLGIAGGTWGYTYVWGGC